MSAAAPFDVGGTQPDERVSITRFWSEVGNKKREHIGARESLTWGELFADLERRAGLPYDRSGWSPATYRGDHRRKENLEGAIAIGLDFEHEDKSVDVDPDRLGDPEKAASALAAFSGIVHSTRNHRPGAPRCRAIVCLSRPVTVDEYRDLYEQLADRATVEGLRVDRHASDASRFWFHPCRPSSGEPVVMRLSGVALDVDATLTPASERHQSAPRREPRSSQGDDGAARYARRALESAMGRLLMAPRGERNNILAREAYGVGQAFAAAGLDLGEARDALRTAIASWDPAYMRQHEGTLDRQLEEGARNPRDIPSRGQRDAGPSGNRGDESPNVPPTPPANDGEIRIVPDLAETMRGALAVLPNDPELYQRGGSLVRIVHDASTSEAKAKRERAPMPQGSPRLRAVDAPVLRYRLATMSKWARFDGRSKSWKEARPDNEVVSAIHSLGEWPGVRPIVGIIETPSLRPDGSVIDTPGYDAATGYVYEPTADFGVIPSRPTRDDAAAAYAALTEPFADFPWAGPERLAAAVSSVLTLLARPAIDGPVPAVVFDKNTPGTGGSLATDVVGLIATGRPPPRMTWPDNHAELAKTLDAYALRSASIVCFDNVATPLTGSALDKYLTSDVVECRVLGRSEAPTVQWRAQILASGNNILIAGDTARRVLCARLETSLERPQDRADFRISDLRAWVRKERARLVRSALVLLRAYFVAGQPDAPRAWGSFESWTSIVGGAIAWACGVDPLGARLAADDAAGDPSAAAHATVLKMLPAIVGNAGGTVRSIVAALYPQGRTPTAHGRDATPPDGRDDLRAALEILSPPRTAGLAPDVAQLGRAFRALAKVVRGSSRLVNRLDRNGVALWWVETLGGAC